MIWARSLAFNVLAAGWTAALVVLFVPLLASRRTSAWGMRAWAGGVLVLLARVAGLGHRLRGATNLPLGPAIVAANHQSAWETVMLHRLLRDPAFVLKRELMCLPNGWYAWRAGAIPVDRDGGAAALRAMVEAGTRAIARGQTVVIFPQGTRTAPGSRGRFHPGVAALYARLGVPVVPFVHNAGLYWGRKTFLKRPGTILAEVLPAIAPGLDRAAFMARLGADIEGAADRLTDVARGTILEQNVNDDTADTASERQP